MADLKSRKRTRTTFQIRFHGRGGRGVVTAAELLAEAAFREGRHAQAFPSFGSERMGAPVMSFCWIDDRPIRTHEPVTEPDALIIQDPTLLHQADLFAGLGREGCMLDAEINRILDMGVTLELNAKVTDILAELAAGFDAAFVAVGAHIGRRAYIPAGDSARILDAVSLLRAMEGEGEAGGGSPPMLGRRVAVYGGGNTAMDAARTARRLGASEAVVVYRRTRDRMPAHDMEVTEALEEGVTMRWLSTISRADQGKLLIEKMRLDETGFPQPTGEFEELEADCLVLALGQNADLSVLENVPGVTFSDNVTEVGPDLMTGHPGIFAGGDMVPSERTVTVAIGHGKKAARHIDAWLHSGRYTAPGKHQLAGSGSLNTWYYADAPATVRPALEAARRITTFDEVVGGLDESTALFEARRCMSCGNCFGCDNCYGVCPDNAIIKLGDGQYEIDYDYCKGCGLCVAECPCGAIEMEPELA